MLQDKSKEQLLELRELANDAYYNDGEAIMTDADFDAIENELGRRGVNLKELKKGGNYGEEVEHFTIMPSLPKVNVKGDFNEGHHFDIIKRMRLSPSFNNNNTYTLHYKLDGLAINAMYEDGRLVKAATRGNYHIGRNVINKVRHMLPKEVSKHVQELRYECVIPIKTFVDKYMDEYSHPRNLASGILNDESILDPRKNDLDLVLLNGVDTDQYFLNAENLDSYSTRCITLSSCSMTYSELNDFETFKKHYEEMMSNRPNDTYPTDGLVLSPNVANVGDNDGKYPNYSVAIKFPPKGAVATVRSLTWSLKKSGEFVPVVNLMPIKIDGRVIKKTHGFNYGFVVGNGIEKGAVVTIEIAGDIIPYLSTVEKQSIEPIKPPKDAIIEGIHAYSNDADAINVEKFIFGALRLGFKDFGEAFYRSVASYFDYNPFMLFDAYVDGLTSLGITDKTAKKFVSRVSEKKSIKLDEVIRIMAIPNCGESTSVQVAKYLAKEYYKINENDFDVDYDFARKQKDVVESCTKGSDKDAIINNVNFIKLLGVEVVLADSKKDAVLETVKYVMTGSPKKSTDYATKGGFKKILPPNFIEVKSLTKDVNILITDSLTSTSSKMKKANQYGIEIRSYESFIPSDSVLFS